jgi:hypothetical protein
MSIDLVQENASVVAAEQLSQEALVDAATETVALESNPVVIGFGQTQFEVRIFDQQQKIALVRETLNRAMALNTGRWLSNTRFVGFSIDLEFKDGAVPATSYRLPIHLNKPWIRSTLQLRVEKRLDGPFAGKSIIGAEDIAGLEDLVGVYCYFNIDPEDVARFSQVYCLLNECEPSEVSPLDRIPRMINRDEALQVLEAGHKVAAATITGEVSCHFLPEFPSNALAFYAAEGLLYQVGILKREERPEKPKKQKPVKEVKEFADKVPVRPVKKDVKPVAEKKARVLPTRLKFNRRETLILLPAKIEVEFIGQPGVYDVKDTVTVELIGQEGDEYFRKVLVSNLRKIKPLADV